MRSDHEFLEKVVEFVRTRQLVVLVGRAPRLPVSKLNLTGIPDDDLRETTAALDGYMRGRLAVTHARGLDGEVAQPFEAVRIRGSPLDDLFGEGHRRHVTLMQVAGGISDGNRPNREVPALGPGITAHSGLLAG